MLHQDQLNIRYEVLAELEPRVEQLIEEHEEDRGVPWFPDELAPNAGERIVLPGEVIAMLVLNQLTEEGLPDFHGLLRTYLGDEGAWASWANLWTAEEDRHGALLNRFLLQINGVDVGKVEEMQFQYLRAGFYPDWQKDPYQLLAYTILQEKATQVSHGGIVRLAKRLTNRVDGTFRTAVSHIAAEEGRHHRFYLAAFSEVLQRDTTAALQALARIIKKFEMPGATIPDFGNLSYLAGRLGVFDAARYKKIVTETIANLKLADLTPPDETAARALKSILRAPKLIDKSAVRFEELEPRHITFSFLPEWNGVRC